MRLPTRAAAATTAAAVALLLSACGSGALSTPDARKSAQTLCAAAVRHQRAAESGLGRGRTVPAGHLVALSAAGVRAAERIDSGLAALQAPAKFGAALKGLTAANAMTITLEQRLGRAFAGRPADQPVSLVAAAPYLEAIQRQAADAARRAAIGSLPITCVAQL